MIKNRVEAFVEGQTFIIENVIVDWASVFKPNTRFRPEWSVQIRVPGDTVQKFFDVGFRLKQQPDGSYTLRARRYCRLDNGDELAPPEVVDADNNPWSETRGLIGNGSLCNVMVRAKYTTYQGVEGLSCYLEGLQVINLVPYEAKGASFGKVQGGNTAGYQGFTPQHHQPPQPQPQAPPVQNPAVPDHLQGAPAEGNVSQPSPALQSGLSGGGLQGTTDNTGVGDDVPF